MLPVPSESLIAVVDDDAAVIRSVSRALTVRGYRVQTFSSARDYLSQRQTLRATCLLADIRMPDVDGLALHRAAHADGDGTPTVFMTATGDIPTVVEAMKAGASDLLAKPFSREALFEAIDAAVGRAQRDGVEMRTLAEQWRLLATLTPRETEVAAYVASGLLNKQVGAATGITEKTVKVHRARAMRKLRAASLAELVRIVDRIFAERERRTVYVDGAEMIRPANADIIARVLTGAPATKAE
jgi:FixJ family two-component response regulator